MESQVQWQLPYTYTTAPPSLDQAVHAGSPAPSDAAAFQLLSLLPPPLLAMVASHLPLVELLLMQRCSLALRRLRGDESYMAVAWSGAKLALSTGVHLLQWSLRRQHHLVSRTKFIPALAWQAAVPALKAVVAERERHERDSPQLRQLRQWVNDTHPTTWIMVMLREDDVEADESDKKVQQSLESNRMERVERVEVLRDITWPEIVQVVPRQRDVEVRCRLVLQACPHLQHIKLRINSIAQIEPSHEDTFALVPRLRSLSLSLHDQSDDTPELQLDQLPVDFERMLDSLPFLASLRCDDMYISISDLLDIASHSTLEELRIEAEGQQMADKKWLGDQLRFPVNMLEEEEWQLAQATAAMTLDASEEQQLDEKSSDERSNQREPPVDAPTTDSVDGTGKAPAWTRDDMQHTQAALSRTQPSRRSCETRLALADWLHRRLWRGGLPTDEKQPLWLLRHYRQQVALVRSTLKRQLSHLLASTTAEEVEATGKRRRLEQFQQLYEHLGYSLAVSYDNKRHINAIATEREWLMGRLDEMTATARRMAVLRLARLDAESDTRQQQAAGQDRRMQLLNDQLKAVKQAAKAAGEEAEFNTLEGLHLHRMVIMHTEQEMKLNMRARTDLW